MGWRQEAVLVLVLTCGLTRTESETRVPSAARGLDTSEARGLDTGDTRPTRGATRGLEKTCVTNVTAQAGMTARMYCCLGVRNKGAEILWMRSRDIVILSHGDTVFTSDARFSVHQDSVSGLSELRIHVASMADSGTYQCSTSHNYDYIKSSTKVELTIEDTFAVIEGDSRHRYIPAGQGLELVCSVSLGPGGGDSLYLETAVVHWTADQRVLQSSPRLQLHTAVLQREAVLQGRLVIAVTRAGDSGNYSCLPSYATPDWVMVHIVTEDEPAGLQLSGSSLLRPAPALHLALALASLASMFLTRLPGSLHL